MAMTVTNQTSNDYWFGPLHLVGGAGQTLSVDDTNETSLYNANDNVADSINTLYANGKITVSGAAPGFPRPVGDPQILHGDGVPEGLIYAPQGSLFIRRDAAVVYQKTTGIHMNTGWVLQLSTGATVVTTAASLPASPYAGQIALLRTGSSAYGFVTLVYDATYGHWVSEEIPLGGIGEGGWPYASATPVGGQVAFSWDPVHSGGLTFQVRWGGSLQRGGTGTAHAGVYLRWTNLAGGSSTSANYCDQSTGGGPVEVGVDWTTVTDPGAYKLCVAGLYCSNSDTNSSCFLVGCAAVGRFIY